MRFEDIPKSLVDQARAGQSEAMEELCLMIQPGAYAVLLSLLRNTEDASDALQESLIRIIRFLPGLRDPQALPAWLMRMLVNQAAASHRQRSAPIIDVNSIEENSVNTTIASTATTPISPRRAAENQEILTHINRAVLQLPDRQRTALLLFEMEHLSIREVAHIMELTDGAVKFHLHEARKNMRQHLRAIGIPDAGLFQEYSNS